MNGALRILAVDDNPFIRQSMRFIFAGPRYELTSVRDGDDALARLQANSNPYHVIIIDQKMPHLTGLELVHEMRKRSIAAKIMVLSAHLTPEIRRGYEQMEINVVLDKPFDIHELRAAVDRLAA